MGPFPIQSFLESILLTVPLVFSDKNHELIPSFVALYQYLTRDQRSEMVTREMHRYFQSIQHPLKTTLPFTVYLAILNQ